MREAARKCAWLDLGQVVVAGRNSPTGVFTIAGDEVFARTDEFCEWKAAHEEMRGSYEGKRFAEAAATAAKLSARVAPRWRGLYMRLADRYAALSRAQLPDDWSAAWILDNK